MRAASDLFLSYLRNLAQIARRGDAREESYYRALAELLEGYGAATGRPGVRVTVLPKRTEEGVVVDFQVWRGGRIAGYIEAKRPGADLEAAEGSRQMARYLEAFSNVILTDFYELRRYRQGKRVERAALESPLAPWYADLLSEAAGQAEVGALLDRFLDASVPPATTAAALAVALARRARLLGSAIEQLLAEDPERTSELAGFYRAFSEFLIRGLSPSEFADLYAQTVAYGLLAARWQAEGEFNLRTVLDDIPRTNGILRDVFRYIALADPRPRIAWIVDDIVELLATSPVHRLLARRFNSGTGKDPILHFYETFLAHYDPRLRERRGVYYTPRPVAGYIVRSIDTLLASRCGRPDGLADRGVTLLDPAAGTLTFVAEACQRALTTYRERHGAGSVNALIRDHLLKDFHAFELMMAPYAVAHLKMSLLLAGEGFPLAEDQRFPLLLTNALELEDLAQTNLPGMSSLSRESREAARIKNEVRIAVVLGNPPYSGHSYNRSRRLDGLLRGWPDLPGPALPVEDEGYYRVDGEALTERNLKWLQDDYVKFLRFAQWKIAQNGWGIVGMVTNHSYLDNPTFRGLRRSLLATFDELYLLDLHGNRKKGETGLEGKGEENVFEGIEQGVAIGIFLKLPGPRPSPLGRAYRADLYGRRTEKLSWLDEHAQQTTAWQPLAPRAPHYFFVSEDAALAADYQRGEPLPAIFPRYSAGVVTARDAFVLAFDRAELVERLRLLRSAQWRVLPAEWGLEDRGGFELERARRAAREDTKWEERFTEILYRPFDVRHLFFADYLVARPRSRLMRHMRVPAPGAAGGNVGLVCPAQCKEEPGALVTDRLAGHKAVSAYDVNSLFPLYLYNELFTERTPNLAPGLLRRLGDAHGREPSPEELLAYVYAVLYSRTYRQRFGGPLRRGFPRIPLTAEASRFADLARWGAELVELHLGRAAALASPRSHLEPRGSGRLGLGKRVLRDYRPAEERVYINAEGQFFDGISPQVWAYRVGGYQVLDRWLASRAGRILGQAEQEAFFRTVTALERTLEIERRIDEVYPEMAAGPLLPPAR
ncbi:MAG TPA: type ISP restriction/modification enzyme [Thermoanaerobaculia bacterium]|nr:type ISP restriction/modification enzyme [Thermoanaerobaculia bacterium]